MDRAVSPNLDVPPPFITSKPGKKDVSVVRALFSYTAQQEDELSFQEGQILFMMKESVDKEWILCKMGDKQGLVPANYVGENTAQISNPLHDAAKRGNISFAKELIDNGVSLNGFDQARNTPIHWACRGGHTEIIQMLLNKNVVVNCQNKLGDTPLHLACWGGHFETVKLLLGIGKVDSSIKNTSGETPLALSKDDKISAFIINYTAQFSKSVNNLVGGESDED